jgi:hypothetical protein
MATIPEVHSTDVVLEEVRRIKEELAAKFDYDVDRILQDAREKQEKSGRRIVQPPARKEIPKKSA